MTQERTHHLQGDFRGTVIIRWAAVGLVLLLISSSTNRLLAQTSWPSNVSELVAKPNLESQTTLSIKKIRKSETQWRQRLDAESFRVTRQKGTEPPFTGKYHKSKRDGVYTCKCCGLQLFDSKEKYDSRTGWPSYTAPIHLDAIGHVLDRSSNMVRTEVVCNRCDAHLGHVFEDGPQPTGLRYCINSVSLKFIDRKTFKKMMQKDP